MKRFGSFLFAFLMLLSIGSDVPISAGASPDDKTIGIDVAFEDITDFNDGKYIGFGNEAAWASSFSNELGFIDLDCLQNYFDFYLTGSIFNLKDWIEVGGLNHLSKLHSGTSGCFVQLTRARRYS